MQKRSIMMLIASAVLIAGILVAGCSDNSVSQTGNTPSPTAVQAGNTGGLSASVTPSEAGSGDKPQFNRSAGGPMGTPPDGMQMNGTRPSGAPPGGMQNGTWPSGAPPGSMRMNGTRPSGPPPSGTPPSGS